MAKKQKAAAAQVIRTCDATMRVPVSDLRPFDDNPRKRVTGKKRMSLRRSILELGMFKPLLVWRASDGDAWTVVGGNQRLDVVDGLVKEGCELDRPEGLPCVVFVGDEKQARLVALRDNNSDGEWDYDILPKFLSDLSASGADIDLAGFDADVAQDLLSLASTDAEFDRMFSETIRSNHGDAEKKSSEARKSARLAQGEPMQFGDMVVMVEAESAERMKMAMVAAKEAGAGDDVSVALRMVADAALSVFKSKRVS